MAIVDYDKSPQITEQERLKSFKESVQRALNELDQSVEQKTQLIYRNLSTGDTKLLFENVAIDGSNAVADKTYPDFPYRLDVELTGCTENLFPTVTCSIDAAKILYNKCESGPGFLKLYCNKKNFKTVLPTILLEQVN